MGSGLSENHTETLCDVPTETAMEAFKFVYAAPLY